MVGVTVPCKCWDELAEPGGGRKTPVPGTAIRGGGCLGGVVVHPVEPGGIGTGVENCMGGATGTSTNNGCVLFGGAWREGAGGTPVTSAEE